MTKWQTKEQLTQLLCELVKIPSISGSQAEKQLPGYLIEQLQILPYFLEHPEHLRTSPTEDGRQLVTALVKKPGKRDTVILISHFDVVGVEDYGIWEAHAFDPVELTSYFHAHQHDLPADVQRDMHTGNWLFGRGTMDMKCGLTLHMSLIEQACTGEFDGNLLLLTVPDEEVNSVGMRAAVPVLLELAREFDLEYKTVLNSEPVFPRFPGDPNNYLYTGSIGKVLPGFLCYGKETHVGEPFAGLNGNFMASQLTCELELNSSFCEVVEGESTPPPTNLMQKDLKKGYSVQIPHRAVTLFNLFLLEKKMDDVVQPLLDAAQSAAERIVQTCMRRAEQFAGLSPFQPKSLSIQVLSYEALHEYALRTHSEEKLQALYESVLVNQENLDDRDLTIELVDQLAILCKELSPMIILFFAPPFYPAISSRHVPLIQRTVAEMEAYARANHQVELIKQNYFGGISDLSYTGLQYPANSMLPLIRNMPLWNQGYTVPLQEMEKFEVPVLNLGPIGRDAHQWSERLHVDYAFDTLKTMLNYCIHTILRDEKPSEVS